MKTPSIKIIIKALKFKNYQIFDSDNEPFFLNIIGIRNNKRKPNSYDDLIIVLWKNNGRWTRRSYHVTTDSVLFFQGNPAYSPAKIILPEGQYLNCFKIGAYKDIIDFNTFMKDLKWGLCYRFISIKINDSFPKLDFKCIHVPHKDINISKLSGRCHIFSNIKEYKEFVELILKARKPFGNLFSYTLINSSDLLGFSQ